jgi:hypothetical protein
MGTRGQLQAEHRRSSVQKAQLFRVLVPSCLRVRDSFRKQQVFWKTNLFFSLFKMFLLVCDNYGSLV